MYHQTRAAHSGSMRNLLRTLTVGVLAFVALGTLSACSGGSAPAVGQDGAAPASFPPSGRYLADVEADGRTMTLGISVDGTEVTAYACNGVDDEAWFFGNQDDGAIDITSKFRDTLSASFDGNDVTGDLTMHGTTYAFTAAAVTDPTGMYTAALDGARASWIVRPDGSVTGVQFNGGISGRDFEQAELQQLNTAQFQSQVRTKRILQQADQSVTLGNRTLVSTINGRSVTAQLVTGTTRFG